MTNHISGSVDPNSHIELPSRCARRAYPLGASWATQAVKVYQFYIGVAPPWMMYLCGFDQFTCGWSSILPLTGFFTLLIVGRS